MTTSTKELIQVYLPREQLATLRDLAAQQGLTLDDLIEQSVEGLLSSLPIVTNGVEEAAGWPADRPIEEHPLWAIVGIGASDVTDLAENHDKYLVEAEEAHNHSWPEQSS